MIHVECTKEEQLGDSQNTHDQTNPPNLGHEIEKTTFYLLAQSQCQRSTYTIVVGT